MGAFSTQPSALSRAPFAPAPSAPAAKQGKKKDKPKPGPEPVPALAGSRPADPLAPRLRPATAGPDRQAREREARKLKARLADLERAIGEKEKAVRDLEQLMATPGFYDDRPAAEKAVSERQRLLGEVNELMASWEELQTQAEAAKA